MEVYDWNEFIGGDVNETDVVSIMPDVVIKATEKAVLMAVGEDEIWVPKSQIIEADEDSNTIWVTKWIAGKKGWI